MFCVLAGYKQQQKLLRANPQDSPHASPLVSPQDSPLGSRLVNPRHSLFVSQPDSQLLNPVDNPAGNLLLSPLAIPLASPLPNRHLNRQKLLSPASV